MYKYFNRVEVFLPQLKYFYSGGNILRWEFKQIIMSYVGSFSIATDDNISKGIDIFPARCKYFNQGIYISTEVEIFPPRFKYFYPVKIFLPRLIYLYPGENIYTLVEICIPRLKYVYPGGNIYNLAEIFQP